MKNVLQEIENEHEETLNAGYFPDCSVFEDADQTIIERIGGYPAFYPWQI